MRLHQKRGLVGGTWSSQTTSNAFVDLETEDLEVGTVQKSSTMLECLVYDPCARNKICVSVAAVPIEHSWTSANASARGNLYMLECIGMLLAKNGGCVRGLVCDSHGTHQHIKSILMGNFSVVPQETLRSLPWFSELSSRPLPPNSLPRLPVAIVLHQEEAVWMLPGVCA